MENAGYAKGIQMIVTVKPHQNMEPAWKQFVQSLPGNRLEQATQAKEFWQEFVDSIIAAKGPPKVSIPDSRFAHPSGEPSQEQHGCSCNSP